MHLTPEQIEICVRVALSREFCALHGLRVSLRANTGADIYCLSSAAVREIEAAVLRGKVSKEQEVRAGVVLALRDAATATAQLLRAGPEGIDTMLLSMFDAP